ncbi:hypothetical protein [Streptomyces griseoviridis]|uniref:hypothetical protein n=1 Tax=Streptomyces griseoviridis TaxID=45398 RepID=UPI003454DA6C
MCDISPAVLRGHIVTLESELSPRYARPILGSLSNIFETAIDDKRLVGIFNAEVWKPALAAAGVIPVRQKGERWKASGKDGFHVAPVHLRLGHPRSGRVRRHPGPLARPFEPDDHPELPRPLHAGGPAARGEAPSTL